MAKKVYVTKYKRLLIVKNNICNVLGILNYFKIKIQATVMQSAQGGGGGVGKWDNSGLSSKMSEPNRVAKYKDNTQK